MFETDIATCFDKISHTALMSRVRERITDKRVLALVKAFLKSGVMTSAGLIRDTRREHRKEGSCHRCSRTSPSA